MRGSFKAQTQYFVSGILTLSGALSAFAAGLLNSKKFERWDLWILSGNSSKIGIVTEPIECIASYCRLFGFRRRTDPMVSID